jgi:hypothetical protein
LVMVIKGRSTIFSNSGIQSAPFAFSYNYSIKAGRCWRLKNRSGF